MSRWQRVADTATHRQYLFKARSGDAPGGFFVTAMSPLGAAQLPPIPIPKPRAWLDGPKSPKSAVVPRGIRAFGICIRRVIGTGAEHVGDDAAWLRWPRLRVPAIMSQNVDGLSAVDLARRRANAHIANITRPRLTPVWACSYQSVTCDRPISVLFVAPIF
jgi:hypothetical protein